MCIFILFYINIRDFTLYVVKVAVLVMIRIFSLNQKTKYELFLIDNLYFVNYLKPKFTWRKYKLPLIKLNNVSQYDIKSVWLKDTVSIVGGMIYLAMEFEVTQFFFGGLVMLLSSVSIIFRPPC